MLVSVAMLWIFTGLSRVYITPHDVNIIISPLRNYCAVGGTILIFIVPIIMMRIALDDIETKLAVFVALTFSPPFIAFLSFLLGMRLS